MLLEHFLYSIRSHSQYHLPLALCSQYSDFYRYGFACSGFFKPMESCNKRSFVSGLLLSARYNPWYIIFSFYRIIHLCINTAHFCLSFHQWMIMCCVHFFLAIMNNTAVNVSSPRLHVVPQRLMIVYKGANFFMSLSTPVIGLSDCRPPCGYEKVCHFDIYLHFSIILNIMIQFTTGDKCSLVLTDHLYVFSVDKSVHFL